MVDEMRAFPDLKDGVLYFMVGVDRGAIEGIGRWNTP